MTLYEKIQQVRCELKQKELKMTGNNTYAGYTYFELSDFVPTLNELMLKHKMTAIPSFDNEVAKLTAYDFESEQTLIITSPMGSASLKGCHEVQNIGAVETYQRRYLYQAMFDVSEKDVLNGTQGRDDVKPKKKTESKKEKQKTRSYSEVLKSMIMNEPNKAHYIKDIIDNEYKGKKSKDLTEEECKAILNIVEKIIDEENSVNE